MDFIFTPNEAQAAAEAVALHFQRQKLRVLIEQRAWPDADLPMRTTLVAIKGELRILIEVQGAFTYHQPLKDLAKWLGMKRLYAELYIATGSDAEGSAGAIHELRRDGVGLLVVGTDGTVHVTVRARNAALVVTPDPTLKYGDCRNEVTAALEKFNDINRKDGLRDLCELVERETKRLGQVLIDKGRMKIPSHAWDAKDWSSRIDALESANSYN